MNSEIMVALISFAGSALGVLAGVIGANKLTEFRLDKIEGKVDELDKKFDAFTDISVRLSVIETRVNDIERKEK
ncbi:MAG: hypothetical protein IKW90_07690 [Lachnospiraceae bacterium]|nr:hypothetical protein [Lachnospiraceae bacterium]